MRKPFTQVNVFSADPLGGNPLAVVHAAEELSEAQMAALARWTNLSETTFLLPPSDLVQHQWVDNGPGWCAVMLRTKPAKTRPSRCGRSSAVAATTIRSPAA